ncbi:MAG: hypothetical protein QOH72_5501 [Solirubrobacteraceae bacterium]|nr:hypothetical protein [Solirubrobacteraceae bacterium]
MCDPRYLRRRLSPAGIALVLYLGVVVVVALLPGSAHRSLVAALAFSPRDLTSGRLWLLPLSAIVIDGETWPQVAVLVQAAAALTVVAGARTFWRAAILAHVGSTLIAYAILKILSVADHPATGDLFGDPDYGVSCVWVGSVGALAVVGARSWGSAHAKVALAATLGVPILALLADAFVTSVGTLDLASVEHLFAFPLGALAGWTACEAPRRARSAGRGRQRHGRLRGKPLGAAVAEHHDG